MKRCGYDVSRGEKNGMETVLSVSLHIGFRDLDDAKVDWIFMNNLSV